jgi:probable F420-dependent oxidoreductase
MTAPIRFSVTVPAWTGTLEAWQAELRRLEDAGFHAVVAADHFTEGWDIEPMVALTAAALSTSTLRVQTGVLGNDYRHPVLVHRMAATLDALSGGRLTLGLGAGWLQSDYEAAGIPLDRPGTRIERLEEAIRVIKGLFRPEPLHHEGHHYRIAALRGAPASVQQPHPPLFLGGGSPRVLRLAGREADIVGIVASLRAGAMGRHAVVDLQRASVEEKLGWVREGIAASGRHTDDVTIEINHWLVRVTGTEAEADAFLAKVAARNDVPVDLLRDSPAVLVGTVPQLVDAIVERRDSLGISYFQLDAGFPPADVASLLPLVAKLA